MSDETTPEEITEENTAPEATPANEEVGESPVNFTTDAGTTEAPASSSDSMEAPLSDSTTSPLPEASDADPLASGASGESSGAPDVSKSDTDSADAPGTDSAEDDVAGTPPNVAAVTVDPVGDKSAKESLKGEHADGEGPTHPGTDTPEKLISNPFNEDTGLSLFPEESHSDEPLSFGAFDEDDGEESAADKMSRALELLGEIAATLN